MGVTVFGVGANAIGALVAMGPAGPVAAVGIIVSPSLVMQRNYFNFVSTDCRPNCSWRGGRYPRWLHKSKKPYIFSLICDDTILIVLSFRDSW